MNDVSWLLIVNWTVDAAALLLLAWLLYDGIVIARRCK